MGPEVVQILTGETLFPFFPFRCPLVSLSYVPRAASAAFPYGGVLAGTLENASFWELKMDFTHWPHVLPMEPGGCVDFQVESSTCHCLVTYRPGECCWGVLMAWFVWRQVGRGEERRACLSFQVGRSAPHGLTALAPAGSFCGACLPIPRLCELGHTWPGTPWKWN